jgi:hypothetical protein
VRKLLKLGMSADLYDPKVARRVDAFTLRRSREAREILHEGILRIGEYVDHAAAIFGDVEKILL